VAHRDALDELDEPWAPRTALIGPFDPLIADRERTESLFGLTYAFELYKPAAKRQYGPYALVALDGDALVGRIDARIDRKARVLNVNAWFPEPGATRATWKRVAGQLEALGEWLGADSVQLPA
jgi:uncharacterized protein YcaQ